MFAPAKLNLGLEVIGKRSDGYHEVASVLQTVSVFDRISLEPAEILSYRSDPDIPIKEDLTLRAVHAVVEEFGISLAANIKLNKGIPVSAGMGGGSSDAGTLLGSLILAAGRTPESAWNIATSLGSDVPFFLRGGSALVTGTGTTIDQLPAVKRQWFVVLVPRLEIPNKTATLYRELTPEDFSDGTATLTQAERIRQGQPLDPTLLRNSFTRPLIEKEPIHQSIEALQRTGAKYVQPTGAGPAVYAVFHSWRSAADAYVQVQHWSDGKALICTTIGSDLNASRLTEILA